MNDLAGHDYLEGKFSMCLGMRFISALQDHLVPQQGHHKAHVPNCNGTKIPPNS